MIFNVEYSVWGSKSTERVDAKDESSAIAAFKKLATSYGSPNAKILSVKQANISN